MRIFGSMRVKILLALAAASALPWLVSSTLYYFQSRQIIVDDRVEIYLRHISQQASDKIDLLITERRAETAALSLDQRFAELFAPAEGSIPLGPMEAVLNDKVRTQEVYDLLVLVDAHGRIAAFNTVNRFGAPFDEKICDSLSGADLAGRFPEEAAVVARAMAAGSATGPVSSFPLVRALCDFDRRDQSMASQMAFAHVIRRNGNPEAAGVLLAFMNWEFVQGNLDLVESDFAKLGLKSGYALLLDRDARKVMASPARKNRKGVPSPAPPEGTELPADLAAAVRAALRDRTDTMEFQVRGTRRFAGIARASLPETAWILVVSLSAAEIFAPIGRLNYTFTLIGAATLSLIALTAFLLIRNISRPMKNLTMFARKLSQGEHDLRAEVRSGGELGELAQAFNAMAETIEERQRELEEANRRLEEKVLERTHALEESNMDLRTALKNLREAQDSLVRSEKLASLGRLVAGIAHEIKNPLNFIYGNTGFLKEYVDAVSAYTRFTGECAGRADAAEALAAYAEEHNIPFILEDLKTIAHNVNEGAERIRAIVDDLRSFSRAPTGSRQPIDVRKVLDMCLNLLRNQYKQRIRVSRAYADLPPVSAHAGKIEQVFLNLLTNAVQAIEGEGEIGVKTECSGDRVVVEIADSGPGIPEHLLQRVFEPFFTTKEVGKGTGLGLSISYNIVRQHGGALTVRNKPGGGAVFRVELPLSDDPPPGETGETES